MPKKISQEEARALFEKAQEVRKKRRRIKRRRGKCSLCHNAPPRSPTQNTCAPCHSRLNIASRRRITRARRKADELAAKEARRREREKRALAKAGENRAYLEFS